MIPSMPPSPLCPTRSLASFRDHHEELHDEVLEGGWRARLHQYAGNVVRNGQKQNGLAILPTAGPRIFDWKSDAPADHERSIGEQCRDCVAFGVVGMDNVRVAAKLSNREGLAVRAEETLRNAARRQLFHQVQYLILAAAHLPAEVEVEDAHVASIVVAARSPRLWPCRESVHFQ